MVVNKWSSTRDLLNQCLLASYTQSQAICHTWYETTHHMRHIGYLFGLTWLLCYIHHIETLTQDQDSTPRPQIVISADCWSECRRRCKIQQSSCRDSDGSREFFLRSFNGSWCQPEGANIHFATLSVWKGLQYLRYQLHNPTYLRRGRLHPQQPKSTTGLLIVSS